MPPSSDNQIGVEIGIREGEGKNAPATTLVKACSCCGISKPVNDYYSKGDRTDSRCKSCVLKSKSKHYSERCSKRQKILTHKPADLTLDCYKIAIFAHENKRSNLDTIRRNMENFVKESLCSA